MIKNLFHFSILLVSHLVNTEVFTATDDLQQFLIAEEEIIRAIKIQIDDYENKLKILKIRHSEYSAKHNEAIRDAQSYLANPINAFLLTKRVTVDFQELIADTSTITLDENEIFSSVMFNEKPLERPTIEDLFGSAIALERLQETYQLHPKTFANGIIKDQKYNTSMTANDCFEMGMQLDLGKKYNSAAAWFEEAIQRIDDGSINISIEDILSQVVRLNVMENKFEDALEAIERILEINPNNQFAMENKRSINNRSREPSKILESQNTIPTNERMLHYDSAQKEAYKKLCRGDLQPTPAQMALLHCKYITNDVPFLKIGPIKMEESSSNPYIVKYYDILYESEMDYIKSYSLPKLARAVVDDFRQNTTVGYYVDYRISKSTWMLDHEHEILRVINQRIEDVTKTSMSSAEPLQIVNYGVGGHYEPHFDFALTGQKSFEYKGTGNRIATLMFYMSDVVEGGATVFPLLNVAVWPKKGSAVFWWNLFKSGGLDYRTKHAGCPVLVGSKWVSNKWIHEIGQEFRRPCQLTPDDNQSNVQFVNTE